MVTDQHSNTHTHRQDGLQYTALQLARSVNNKKEQLARNMEWKLTSRYQIDVFLVLFAFTDCRVFIK